MLDDIPSARFHDGGRIKFGPDDLLYVTTGDATDPPSAQNIDSVAGKLLRINTDGSAPEDNPYDNLVYSYGHRNSQGFDWNEDGKLFASEHGPTRNDEINIIVKGENYGWPEIQCDEISEEFTNPIRCFDEFTLAPSGLAYYDGNLYVAGLRSAQIRKLTLDEAEENIISEEVFAEGLGRIREAVVYEGYLYFTTSNRDGRGFPAESDDRILRVKL